MIASAPTQAHSVSSLASACRGETDEHPPAPGGFVSSSSSGTTSDNDGVIGDCLVRSSANLAAGQLHTYAEAHARSFPVGEAAAEADASFSDALRFFYKVPSNPGPIPVTLRLNVTGGFQAGTNGNFFTQTDFRVAEELDPIGNPGVFTLVVPRTASPFIGTLKTTTSIRRLM